jgi:uncharacterized protein YndB with AHSA1/START domain
MTTTAAASSHAGRAASSPDTSLVIRRSFGAPVEALWDAWTKPEQICVWMGPAIVVRCETLRLELRRGGGFRLRMHEQSGAQHVVYGEYLRIDRPRLLSFTWFWEGEDRPGSHVTVELARDGEGAAMTLTHTDFADSAARDHHDIGWSGSFDKLDALVAGGAAGGGPALRRSGGDAG